MYVSAWLAEVTDTEMYPRNGLLDHIRQVCVGSRAPRTGLVAGRDEFNPKVGGVGAHVVSLLIPGILPGLVVGGKGHTAIGAKWPSQ